MLDAGQNRENGSNSSAGAMKRHRVAARTLLVLLALASLIVLWVVAWHEIEQKRLTELSAAEIRTVGKAEVFAAYSVNTIKRVDEILLDLRDHWSGDAGAFAAMVSKRQEHIADIAFQVAVIDSKGWLVFSNLGQSGTPVDLSAREHFRVHQEAQDADRLFISTPVLGKVSGKWSIQFTRPLFDHGRFGGVLVISLSPDVFETFGASLLSGMSGAVGLVSESGKFMARYPSSASYYGTRLKDRHYLRADASPGGFFRQISGTDGVDRVFGYRKNLDYGLNFVVGESVDDVLKPYMEYRAVVLDSVALLSLLFIAAFLALYRNISSVEQERLKTLKAKDALQKNQTLLRSVIDNIDDPIFIKDRLGRFVIANQALATLYATTPEGLVGKDDIDFGVPEEIFESYRQSNQRVLDSGETEIVLEDGRGTISGEIRHYHSVKKPFQDGLGNWRILVVAHDLTDVIREHEKVLAREQRLREVLEATREGTWEWHVSSGSIVHNTQWFELLGYADGEIAGTIEAFGNLIHEDDRAAVFARIDSLIKGESAYYDSEHHLKGKDRLIWVHDRGSIVERDAAGGPVRVVGSYMDITARHEAEEKSSALLKQQQALLQSDVLGIVVLRTRIIDWVNTTVASMLGYTAQELLGMPARLLYANDEGYRALREAASPVLDSGNVFRMQLEMRRKDGCLAWFDVRGSKLSSDDELTVWSIVDISSQKRTEADLIEARQVADRASQAKSDFLATMSHEIRTPMNGILGMTQLLLDADLPAQERADYVQTILQSSENLLELLNSILDLSKIEAGQITLERRVFSVNLLLAQMLTLHDERARRKGLVLQVEGQLPEASSQFWGDPLRLRQMVSILLDNAIKFTASGKVSLTLTPGSGDSALRFSVSDSGIGVPLDKQDRLFKAFSQVDSSITRRFGGTGLGLSILKQLIELMGGRSGFHSIDGQGSSFWFELALERVSPDEALAAMTPARRARSEGAEQAKWHILVAEDTLINAKLLEVVLGKAGHRVSLVGDGQAAVDWVMQHGAPDLVLMDCQMPVMDGLEATRQIRAWEAQAGREAALPIVGLSASAFESDRLACLAAGMNEFLSKPFHFDDLYAVLDASLPDGTREPVERSPLAPAVGRGDEDRLRPLRRADEAQPINVAAALDRLGGDRETFLLFAAAVPAQIEQDRAAIVDAVRPIDERHDTDIAAERLRKASHRLGGSLGTLGAERAQAACLALEVAARRQDRGGWPALLQELDEALAALNPALLDILNNGPTAWPEYNQTMEDTQ